MDRYDGCCGFLSVVAILARAYRSIRFDDFDLSDHGTGSLVLILTGVIGHFPT